MPKRSEKRDSAKAEYIAQRAKGEKVDLRKLAEEQGVKYQTLRNWKAKDRWDDELPKRKRGGQPGNENSKGKKNASGSHKGAPLQNKTAEKDGAYSTIFFDMLSDSEKEIADATPTDSRAALVNELQILKVREHRILEKIAKYEAEPEDTLHLTSLMDMREPSGRGKDRKDGARQQMGMYTKDTAFARTQKLEEALNKTQGRIATIINSLRATEESSRRNELELAKLEILKTRATGVVVIDDPAGSSAEPDTETVTEDSEGNGMDGD
jgi:uncharacterized protein YjcR